MSRTWQTTAGESRFGRDRLSVTKVGDLGQISVRRAQRGRDAASLSPSYERELEAVRRALRKLTRKPVQIEIILCLKPRLSDLVLLDVVGMAEADAPSVRRLYSHAAVGTATHVRAFDGQRSAAAD